MTVQATKYVRKPLYVDAVLVTEENFEEVLKWCQGDLGEGDVNKHIRLRVHNPQSVRQTKAFVGDWILYTERGYKIYTDRAFRDNFTEVGIETEPEEKSELESLTSPDPVG
jgi:hypothetical protein